MDSDRVLLHNGGQGSTALLALMALNHPGALDDLDIIHVHYGQESYRFEKTAVMSQAIIINDRFGSTLKITTMEQRDILSISKKEDSKLPVLKALIGVVLSRRDYRVVYVGDSSEDDCLCSVLLQHETELGGTVKLRCPRGSMLLNNTKAKDAIEQVTVGFPELMETVVLSDPTQ